MRVSESRPVTLPPTDRFNALRRSARRIADARSARAPSVIRNDYASVLGEVMLARSYDLDPDAIDTDEEHAVQRVDGFATIVLGVSANERSARISPRNVQRASYVLLSTHFAETAAASLVGWIDARRIAAHEFVERVPERHYRIPVSAFRRMDGLDAELERRAAEDYALTLLIDRRMTLDGGSIDVYWWTDKYSAAIQVNGKTTDYIYRAERAGIASWFRVNDRSNRAYLSWKAARDAAIDDAMNGRELPTAFPPRQITTT